MTLTYHRVGRRAVGSGRAEPARGHRPDAPPHTTLWTPASACMPPARHTMLTERDPSAPLPHKHAAGGVDGGDAPTTYGAAHPPPAGIDYSKDPRVRRPGGVTDSSWSPPPPEQAQFGRSTYQMELLQRSAADIRGTASAPSSPARTAGAALTAKPGFLTSSAAATAPVAERFAAASAAGVTSAASRSAGNSPVARAASSTTAGAGAAACLRDSPPAWAGPRASQRAGAGQQQQEQQFSKEAAFLYALDQHSRGRLPGCSTHKPRHANVALEQAPPTKQTTWGAASQEALRWSLPAEKASHGIKSSLMGFFSAGSGTGGGFVSENGQAEAARYHETTRPMEGRVKTAQPSRTTVRGAPFTG